MSAVLIPERNAEQAYFDTQQLPPEKRGVSFEALFDRDPTARAVADLFAAAVETGMRTLKMDGMEKIMLRPHGPEAGALGLHQVAEKMPVSIS
jgi:hypothetical protein